MQQTHFYISQSGREIGPLELSEILNQHDIAQLSGADFVYVEEKEDWISISDFVTSHRKPKSAKLDPKIIQQISKDVDIDFPTDLHFEFSNPTSVTKLSSFDNSHETSTHKMTTTPAPTFTPAPTPTPTLSPSPAVKSTSTSTLSSTVTTTPIPTSTATATSTPTSDLNTGEFYLDDLKAGTFFVNIEDKNNSNLKERIELNVTPGIAQNLRIIVAPEIRAGEKILITAKALDLNLDVDVSFKQTISGKCTRFESHTSNKVNHEATLSDFKKPATDDVALRHTESQQSATMPFTLVFINGTASIELKQTKAARYELSVDTQLSVLAGNAIVEVVASSPHSIRVEAPREVRAGEKIKIRLAAFDEFDNRCNPLNSTFKVDIESQNGSVLTSFVELNKISS